MKGALASVFFDSTVKRCDGEGVPFVAFRVEVTTSASDSYALSHVRYSSLHALHEELAPVAKAAGVELPPFPGKTWTAPSDAVWKERCSALNAYFYAVLANAALAGHAGVVKMFARTPEAEQWTPPASDSVSEVGEGEEKERFKFADVDTGLRLGYIDRGDPSHPLVVFVHGFPDTLWTFDKAMIAVAAKGFYCVSVAQRGHYPSAIPASKPEEADWQRYGKHVLARDVLGLVKALGRTGAVLVGHDFGALAVWAAAVIDQREGTGLVSRVVGEALPPPKAIAFKPGLVFKARHMVYYNTPLLDTVKGTKDNNFVYLEALVDRLSPTWKRSNRVLNTTKRYLSLPGRTEAAVAYYRGLMPPKQANDLYEPLNTTDIKCPVLFICGEEESGGGMVDMFKQTAAQCAGFCEVVVVREAGHFVHLEKPNGFLHKLLPFLEMSAVADGKQVKIKYVQETGAPILEPRKMPE